MRATERPSRGVFTSFGPRLGPVDNSQNQGCHDEASATDANCSFGYVLAQRSHLVQYGFCSPRIDCYECSCDLHSRNLQLVEARQF